MCESNETLEISREDHLKGIVHRVYEGWGTTQIVNSWIENIPGGRILVARYFEMPHAFLILGLTNFQPNTAKYMSAH